MPPRIINGPAQAGGLGSFIESIPPITRAFAGTIFCLALGAYVQLINPYSLALIWPQVTQHYHVSVGADFTVLRGKQRCSVAAAACCTETAVRAAMDSATRGLLIRNQRKLMSDPDQMRRPIGRSLGTRTAPGL
jgi:hypothetical protein